MKALCAGLVLVGLTVASGSAHAESNRALPVSVVHIPREQVRKQRRSVHPNYASLSGGIVLFSAAYALAIAEPLRHGFDGASGHRAYPLAGPWFPRVSWAWALDGVLQLGGAAFIANAFLNPVIVVGTPLAAEPRSFGRDGFVGLRGEF